MNAHTSNTNEMSFVQVYETYYNEIFNRIIHRINGNRMAAEEITNDVFVNLNKHLAKYDPERAKLRTWIYSIANNKIIDYYRKNNENIMVHVDGYVNEEGKETFEYVDETRLSDNKINNEEVLTQVEKVLSSLRVKEQAIARLYFIDQKKYDEIAKELELPIGTVKGSLNRIRGKLQKKLSSIYATL